MKAALLIENEHFDLVDIAIPTPSSNEILIKVHACGLCKSEIHLWEKALPGFNYSPGFPGHEVIGEVIDFGNNIKDINTGDIITTISFPGLGYAEFMIVPENHYAILPENLKNQTILGEPLACAMNALRRKRVLPGDRVLFIGTGFMGNLLLKLLKRESNPYIIAADHRELALNIAKENGADELINTQKQSLIKEIKDLTGNEGVDIVIEAVGSQEALDYCADVIRVKGTIIIFGYHDDGKRMVDFRKWNWKGLNIINAHERDQAIYVDGMKRALQMLEAGRFQFNLITHEFSLDQINDAFRYMRKTPDDYMKGIIRFN